MEVVDLPFVQVIAIIGAGHIASVHGPIILDQPDDELVGIEDKDLVRAKSISDKLNKCGIPNGHCGGCHVYLEK